MLLNRGEALGDMGMLRKPKQMKRCLITAVTAAVFATLSFSWTASALQGFTSKRLWIVNEPQNHSKYIDYYVGDKEKPNSALNWVDNGHTGKAVSLSGNGELLDLDYNQLQMHTMTIAGWFYWRGAAEGKDETTMYTQRFLTLSRSDDTWLTLMPHAKDEKKKDENGNTLNGVYMAFSMGKGNNRVFYEFWNPAPKGISYGIPLNQWHHIALTMNGQYIRLYIDGRLWFERMLILGVEEMRNNTLSIGGGRWGDPTLNGLVDDLAIYSFAMNQKQISMLNAGVDPLASNASLPQTTRRSLPQSPTTQTPGSSGSTDDNTSLLGLPAWTVYMAGGLFGAFILLSVLLNIYKPGGKGGKQD